MDYKALSHKIMTVPIAIMVLLVIIRWQYGILLFHTLAELFSVLLGMLMFAIAWNMHQLAKNNFLIYLGIGYFWVAVLDTWHMYTMQGMPFFNGSGIGMSLHIWIYPRLFEACLLLSAPIFLSNIKIHAYLLLVTGGVMILLLSWANFFFISSQMLTLEGFTVIKAGGEYSVIAILCLSIAIYFRFKDSFATSIFYFLIISISLTILAEVLLTVYTGFSGVPFVIAHLFKFLSFWLIYLAIVETSLTRPLNRLTQVYNSYDAIPQPIIVVSNDCRITLVNRAAEAFAEQSASELLDKPVHHYFHPKDISIDECEMCQAIINGTQLNEHQLYFADKRQSFLSSLALLNNSGHTAGMVQSFTDISKQVLVEEGLRKSEALFRKLFEKTDAIPVQGYDKDRNVIYWNPASEILYGYSKEQALGKKIEDLIIPDEMRHYVIDAINNWMQGGVAIPSSELTLKKSDGSAVQVYSSHLKYYNHDNEVEMYCIDVNLADYKETQTALMESEMMLAAITNQSVEGISVADIDGRYTFVNDAFCKMTGYSEAELHSMSIFDVKAPEQDRSFFERSKTSEEGCPIRVLLQRKNKTTFMSEIIGKGIQIGGVQHVLGVVRDISDLVLQEQSIRTLSQAVEQTPVSILIADKEGKIEYVNHAFEHSSGYTQEEIKGKNPRILQSGNMPMDSYKELWDTVSSGKAWQGEMQSRKKNGDVFWEYGHITPVTDEQGVIQHYLSIKEDITLRKQQQEQISHQAHFDTLTDLPNRFLSLDRLAQLLREAKRHNEKVAVLFLDLDDFKKINDTLGHATGDKLLIEVARRLLNVTRSEDTVGRLGGDEFLILLGGLKENTEAAQVAEVILSHLVEVYKIEGRELIVSASIGVTISPDDGVNPAELLRDADAAMYNAKALGRNTYSFFTEEMNKNLQHRLILEEQIYGALKRNEFTVFYQPKVDFSTGKIMGAEALLRWDNPMLGNVPPNEFIAIAEQSGLIAAIGQFVLTTVLHKTAYWQKNYVKDFCIAINLSPVQFRDPSLVKFIENTLNQSGVSNDTLELEITEGVLMNGYGYINSVLSDLNKLGVNIAMDDFGTGYSSLSYLRNYPFDVLKIDKSFINDITVDPADRELIIAIIAMAHGLNLKVVAEGIETQEQYDDLKGLGCDYGQGYLLGTPMTENEMTELLCSL